MLQRAIPVFAGARVAHLPNVTHVANASAVPLDPNIALPIPPALRVIAHGAIRPEETGRIGRAFAAIPPPSQKIWVTKTNSLRSVGKITYTTAFGFVASPHALEFAVAARETLFAKHAIGPLSVALANTLVGGGGGLAVQSAIALAVANEPALRRAKRDGAHI